MKYFHYENEFAIAALTGASFNQVCQLVKRLGFKRPFTLLVADEITFKLTGFSSMDLYAQRFPDSNNIPDYLVEQSSEFAYIHLSRLASGGGECKFCQWLVADSSLVQKGQVVMTIVRSDSDILEKLSSPITGLIKHLAQPLDTLEMGQILASVNSSVSNSDLPPSRRRKAVGSPVVNSITMIRIYEISRALGISNEQVLEAAESLLIGAKSYSSSITDADATRISNYLSQCDDSPRWNACSIVKQGDSSSSNLSPGKNVYKDTFSNSSPSFSPSFASPAALTASSCNAMADLFKCISNQKLIQSFWSDLIITDPNLNSEISPFSIRDEVLHVPPFDESLYCQIVLENHRYSLADLYDRELEESDRRASTGFKLGSLYGLFTLNPLVPFFASNQARLNTPKHKKIEELIPDPKLLFLQDNYSLLSMTQAGTPLPRMRRLILHPVISGDHVFVRTLPAVLTHDSVIPCQIFSFGKNYFMRPICAGINYDQLNYNARQIHRHYYHLRLDGGFEDTGARIEVKGADIVSHRYKLYKFTCDTRELEYYYIDYATEPGHVF